MNTAPAVINLALDAVKAFHLEELFRGGLSSTRQFLSVDVRDKIHSARRANLSLWFLDHAHSLQKTKSIEKRQSEGRDSEKI